MYACVAMMWRGCVAACCCVSGWIWVAKRVHFSLDHPCMKAMPDHPFNKAFIVAIFDVCTLFIEGRWSPEEHDLFVKSFEQHGRQWKLLAEVVRWLVVPRFDSTLTGA